MGLPSELYRCVILRPAVQPSIALSFKFGASILMIKMTGLKKNTQTKQSREKEASALFAQSLTIIWPVKPVLAQSPWFKGEPPN